METVRVTQGFNIKPFRIKKETILEIILLILFLIFLYLTRTAYHLLFHSAAEIFVCFVSFGLFLIAINTNRVSENNFIVFLGIGFLFIGIIDMFHIFTYKGMSIIFPGGSQSIVVQFWISGRYLTALTLLGSAIMIYKNFKRFRTYFIFFTYFILTFAVVVSILYFKIFPQCYILGKGLTEFKIVSEYIVSTIYIVVAIMFFNLRKNMDFKFFLYLEFYLLSMVASELLFTNFFSPFDWTNVWSHIIRVISYFFLYKAIFETGLRRPYTVLYHKINKIGHELNKASNKLKQEEQQRIMIEEMMVKSDHCYELIINNSSDAIIVTSDTKFIFANERAAQILREEDPGKLIGRDLKEYIDMQQIQKVIEHFDNVLSQPETHIKYECKLKTSNGSELDLEVTSDYLFYNGSLSYISIIKDVSSTKQINKLKNDIMDNERELSETKEYNKLLTEFFSNISHELKTPLNVILGAIQILGLNTEADIPPKIETKYNKYHRVMKQNCYRLLRLVNNLIDLSKFDSGYLKLNLSNQNIVSIVEEITLSVADYVENKGLIIVFDTDVEEKIMAVDADKIERIILNLLSNSIKFTDADGSIFVNILDNGSKVAISVRDTGIGIPEDKINSIFDRFGQVDKTLTRNREGSGIGLSLVKTLVEMHGGVVGVSSIEGEGTEVKIELPVVTVEHDGINDNSISGTTRVEKIKVEFSDIYSILD
jgi:PAS domain S-box-containing protein